MRTTERVVLYTAIACLAAATFMRGTERHAVATAAAVASDLGPADAVISITKEDFLAMAAGELDGMMAFMQGKLRVQGDMMLAQRLGPLLKG